MSRCWKPEADDRAPQRGAALAAARFSQALLAGFNVQTAYDGVFADVPAFNRKVRLLWLGAGSAEERFATAVRQMHETLDQAGIQHVAFESPGTSHEWQTWRRSLYDFAPRLVQGD